MESQGAQAGIHGLESYDDVSEEADIIVLE